MLRGYRSIIFALGFILTGAQQPAEQPKTGKAAQQAESRPSQAAAPIPSTEPYFQAYPYYNPDPCYQAKDHDAADLCAQWRAALAAEKAAQEAGRATNWAIVAAVLSFVTVGGLIYSIWQTDGALEEARKGNRIAQKANARATRQAIHSANESRAATDAMRESNKIADEAQRAWVTLKAVPQLIQRGAGDALYFHIDFIAKNIGGSAATNFDFNAEIFFIGQGEDGGTIDDQMTDLVETWAKDYGDMGASNLLPNDEEVSEERGMFSAGQVKWWITQFQGKRVCKPALLAAVFYETPNKPGIVQSTWRSWYLGSFNDDGNAIGWVSQPLIEHKAKELRVFPFRQSLMHQEYSVDQGHPGFAD